MAGLSKLGGVVKDVVGAGVNKVGDWLTEELREKAAPPPEVSPNLAAKQAPAPEDTVQEIGAQGERGPIEAAELQGTSGQVPFSPQPQRRNINLDLFADESTKATIEFYNKANNGFLDDPNRKPVTHAETIEKSIVGEQWSNAERMAKVEAIVGKGKANTRWEPEDIVSLYKLTEAQGGELYAYANELKMVLNSGAEVSTEEWAKYGLMETRMVATQQLLSNAATDAGRLLNSFQAVGKAGGREYFENMAALVNGSGGPAAMKKRVQMMADADPDNIADIAAKARLNWHQKLVKGLVTWRYNMMLSSVRTHGANIAGSTFTGVLENILINPLKVMNNNVEFVGRALVHKTFGKGGMRMSDRVALSEIVTLPTDTIMAGRASLLHARDVFKGDAMGGGKVYNEIGTRATGHNKFSIPTNLLEAEDAFFKSIYESGMHRQLARRQAMREGESAAEVKQLMNRYMENPTNEMVDRMREYGQKLTFTNDPNGYGTILGGLAKGLSAFQQNSQVGRLIFPFVRTPMNLVGYAMDNTGVGKMVAPGKFLEDLKAPETRADAVARLEIAAGLLMVAHSYWEAGDITGAAPANYGELRVREATGWRANSIRIGDNYVELNRVDPLGLMLGTYATAFEVMAASTTPDEGSALIAAMMTSANLISDRSVLSGIGDVERVFRASETTVGKMGGKWLARLATSFVIPAIARDVREMTDDKARVMEVPDDLGGALGESMLKSFMNAVPGLSDNLPPQVDAFGKNKVNIGHWAYRGLVPLRRGKLEMDPVAVAIIAVNAPVNKPDSKVTFLPNGPKIDLLAMDDHRGWVYYTYQKHIGRQRYALVKELVQSRDWQELVDKDLVNSNSVAAKLVRSMLSKAKAVGTKEFITAMAGKTHYYPTVEGKQVAGKVELSHPITLEMLEEYTERLMLEGPTPDLRKEIDADGLSFTGRKGTAGLPPEMQLPPRQGTMPGF